MALDHGTRGTKAALSFFNALSWPVFGNRLCPHCKLAINQDHTYMYLEHLLETHRELQLCSVEEIIHILVSDSPAIIWTGKRLLPLSSPPYYFMDILCHCKLFVYVFSNLVFPSKCVYLVFCYCLFFLLCISPLEPNTYELWTFWQRDVTAPSEQRRSAIGATSQRHRRDVTAACWKCPSLPPYMYERPLVGVLLLFT